MSTSPPPNSKKIILDLVRERAKAQFDQIGILDQKANGLMTISSTLLGAALVLQAALINLSGRSTLRTFEMGLFQIGLIVLLVTYLLALLPAAIAGYWVKQFQRVPEPGELVKGYRDKPEEDTEITVAMTMASAFTDNESQITTKVVLLQWAFGGLCGEILMLLILLYAVIHLL